MAGKAMTSHLNPLTLARNHAGLSREDLAEKAGVNLFTIERIEHGLTRSPQAKTLSAIAAALAVDAGELGGQILEHHARAESR